LDPYASQQYNSKQKNTVEAAIEREITRLYGPEIDAYDKQLRAAEESDSVANELIDQ